MVVNICLIGLEGMIIKRCIEVLDCLFELFVLIECKASLVEDFRICCLTGESIREVINCFGVLLNIDVDVASLHQKVLVLFLPLQRLIQIV